MVEIVTEIAAEQRRRLWQGRDFGVGYIGWKKGEEEGGDCSGDEKDCGRDCGRDGGGYG